MKGKKIINLLKVAAGFLLLGFGAAGLLLPVLPTTPFVLAAFACFASVPKLRGRLMRLPFFSEHIKNYRERAGLSKKSVAISLGFLWGMLLISILHVRALWLIVLLAAIGAAVTVHILVIARPKQKEAQKLVCVKEENDAV